MYQALYRKWRPKTFADVIGQPHITETLQRQVAEGRLSHAYLFTGTRGTGKTTCAKILAKAVNCERPVNGDPCNECPACRGIDSGSLLDVLELDAASNNGVDQVRALREDAVYSPAHVKYRVYIVDEVHMLSGAAFNALLKILEEPPAHLIFILATTELHKVPATILSRCQRFAFKRIAPRDIAQRLLTVARAEEIPLTPGGAELIARLADGALRDALSLLDQCASAEGDIDGDKILDILGLAGNLQTGQLMEHILRRDVQGAILLLGRLYASGKEVSAVLGELSVLARDMLIRATAPEGGEGLLSGGYDNGTLDTLSALAAPRRLLHISALLQSTAAGLPLSINRRTDAELCLLRLCDESLCGDVTALAARLERLEAQLNSGSIPVGRPAPRTERRPEPVSEPIPEPMPEPMPPLVEDPPPWAEEPEAAPVSGKKPAPRQKETPAPPVPAAPAAPDGGEEGLWDRLIDAYKARLPAMYRAFLDGARGTMEGDLLSVVCASDFTKTQLHNVKVQSVLQEVTSDALGRPVSVSFSVGELPPAPAGGGRDKLEDLIQLGSQFDNFTIK